MANSLNMNLEGKTVILRQSFFRAGLVATDHPFEVGGGFGAQPFTQGRALGGTFLSDGEVTRVDGYDVERLATEEEIAAVRKEGS